MYGGECGGGEEGRPLGLVAVRMLLDSSPLKMRVLNV